MRQKILLLGLLAFIATAINLDASLTNTQPGMVWQQTAFSPANQALSTPSLYLGGSAAPAAPLPPVTPAQQALVLARAYLSTDDAGNPAVNIDPLAPVNATNNAILLNGVAQNSPLNNQTISNLTLLDGDIPVVTIAGNPNVYLVISPTDGTDVLTNIPTPINDAGLATPTPPALAGGPIQGIVALATGSFTVTPTLTPIDFIAAAVSANGSTGWDDSTQNGVNRGIALLTNPSNTGLVTMNATNFATTTPPGNQATGLSVLATFGQKVYPAIGGPVAFAGALPAPAIGYITGASLGPKVEMFFDNTLQRLYIGLQNVKRVASTNEGGVLGIVLGAVTQRLQGAGELDLLPIIDGVNKSLFYGVAGQQNVNNRIVGFYYDAIAPIPGQLDVAVTIKQINVMHTSTGKSYLIVNSNIAVPGGGPNQGVYALPLLGITLPNGNPTPIQQIGTISQVTRTTPSNGIPTFAGPPTQFSEMPSANDVAVAVKSESVTNINNIFVQGDTIYMVNGTDYTTAGNVNSGIFASTAIFASDGSIRNWTEMQRVDGSIDRVMGGGLDTISQPGDFYSLTSASLGVSDTVKITQWGTSDAVTAQQQPTPNNLSSLLESLFPVEEGGVLGLYSFDRDTPGLSAGTPPQFAMMVAVGVDRIALIQTATASSGGFSLTQNFIADPTNPNQNVFVFDATPGSALGNIMPLTGAEVSRTEGANTGWLFVCGLNGVAVLSMNTGNGWVTGTGAGLTQLSAGYFPGLFTFKQLTPSPMNMNAFTNVRKLVASNGRMYVQTLDGIFYFDMIAGKFTPPLAAPLAEQQVAKANLANRLIADMVVLSPDSLAGTPNTNVGVIATDKGIWASDLQNNALMVQPINGEISDLALQLQLVGNLRSQAPANGNVYVLATDFATNNDTLYRFDVPDATAALNTLVKPVQRLDSTGLTQEFNNSVQSFMTDGTFDYSALPKNYGSTNYLTLTSTSTVNSTGPIDVTPLLDLDLSQNKYISGVIREGASGTIMVPGDWGVRVNQ